MTKRILTEVPAMGLSLLAFTSMAQGVPDTATVRFGVGGVGSIANNPNGIDFGHDQSVHAADMLVPRTATVAVGGTVTFVFSNPVHQLAVYHPGKLPSDVDTGSAANPAVQFSGCPGFGFVSLYSNDPLLRAAVEDPPCAAGGPPFDLTVDVTFDAPDRYLVICGFNPHFLGADMYGWVIVK